ncbi:hypothetical protein CRG98_047441, partial [Punica granatum]
MGRDPPLKRKKKAPSFFKLFLGDFPSELKVPPAFVKNFRRTLPNKVWVKSDGRYLSHGWEKIARDLKLKLGDLLISKLVAEEALEVVVYDPTSCEKEI